MIFLFPDSRILGRYFWLSRILAATTLALFTCFGCHSNSQGQKSAIKLYYVNIGVETLVPVTAAEITQKGRYCEIRSAPDVEAIQQTFTNSAASSKKNFSDKSVRVKLLHEDGSLIGYIDNYGGTRFADGRDGTLSSNELKSLKHLIETRCAFQSWIRTAPIYLPEGAIENSPG